MRTIIKNTSGSTKVFSFLPPHGRTLADDEEIEILGDLMTRLRTERAKAAFEDAIQTGELSFVSTPAPIIVDDTTGDSKQVILDSGTLDVDDPRIASL